MDFEFLEDEPDLLVEKILSVDPEWLGNADIEFYGRDDYGHGSFIQSNSTKVPCLEGEWVVVCYGKAKRKELSKIMKYGEAPTGINIIFVKLIFLMNIYLE